jgi:ADP-L-glycero-D-manno-heptose 6-epimerase
MIIVTGAAGFIGSALLGKLQELGYGELVAVDDFSATEKAKNWQSKGLYQRVEREQLWDWLPAHASNIQFVFHIGARTKTNEFDEEVLQTLNVEYSQKLWQFCVDNSIPLIYASSAATYGDGGQGFSDDPQGLCQLKPLNPYGSSKHRFDLWVMEQLLLGNQPPFWAGFKFFNVFGPNEYHKGRMASVVFHAFNQIRTTRKVSLFKSHQPDYKDGEQERDFVYVKDVLNVLMHFFVHRKNGGLYNLGTGECRTFLDLATAVFEAMNVPVDIEYIDMPADIRDRYQYHTQANMQRIRNAGYTLPFTPLEVAVADYVKHYLESEQYL